MGRGKYKGTESALRLTLGNNVKRAREYVGLSQRELCALTNISQPYLSQVESGRWNIGIDNITKISNAVGVAPHDLLNPAFVAEAYFRSAAVPTKSGKRGEAVRRRT
jgi:transcriptional regulator with XRE-family HTH domain